MKQDTPELEPVKVPKVPEHRPETHGLMGTHLASRTMAPQAPEPAYEHQEYPKHVTRPDGVVVEVKSKEDELKLDQAQQLSPPKGPDPSPHPKDAKMGEGDASVRPPTPTSTPATGAVHPPVSKEKK
jgi:hypothetical protein